LVDVIIQEFITLYVAGTDTTSSLIGSTLAMLVTRPDVMQKVIEEITSIVKSDDDITFENIAKLQYLHAVFKETLRLYSPTKSNFLRVAIKDNKIGNYEIKKRNLCQLLLLYAWLQSQILRKTLRIHPRKMAFWTIIE